MYRQLTTQLNLFCQGLESQVAELNARNRKLESELNSVKAEKAELVELVSKQESNMEELTRSNTELKARLADLTLEIENMQDDLGFDDTQPTSLEVSGAEQPSYKMETDLEIGEIDQYQIFEPPPLQAHTSQQSESNDHGTILDPIEVARNVRGLLKRLGMKKIDISRELGILQPSLCFCLNTPQPWELLTAHKREQYIKLNDWYMQNRSNEVDVDLEEEPVADETLNTAAIAVNVRSLLDKIKLPVSFLSKKLNISQSGIFRLINEPRPWNNLNDAKKSNYRKLKAWLVDNQYNKPIVGNLTKLKHKPAIENNKCLGPLDPAEVGRNIVQFLDSHGIGHGTFADRKLYISAACFYRLVCSNPMPRWQDLSKTDKDLYVRMHKWTQASDEQINKFKRYIELRYISNSSYCKNKKRSDPELAGNLY
jgi:hypothetical protein